MGSTAALACVAHFFAWFFWNPIGFADWYYRDGALKFVSAIYGLTVWLAMSYYIYIIIAHALSWMPPWIDFGDATTAEGVAMLGGSVLGFVLIQAMGELASQLRKTKRECEQLWLRLEEARRPSS